MSAYRLNTTSSHDATLFLPDTLSLKTSEQTEERGYYAGKKILGRKSHVALNCLGLILANMITPAVVQDRAAARPFIKGTVSMYGRLQIIWADAGYLGALVSWVKELRPFGKLRLEIVPHWDEVKGFKVLPRRWVVEREFRWLFKSRRFCRDYEVRLEHSETMIRICMIGIIVRRLAAM
jgi:transposase